MNVAMMQPSFLPWQGYFGLILKSDTFIFLDDFQFSVQSYHQRNKLFVNKEQVGWYTVPVSKSSSFLSPLNLVTISEETNWRERMWKRIKNNYSKAPYFSTFAPWLEEWILEPAENIASQNISFIKYVCNHLSYDGEFRFSSDYQSNKLRSERVLELLRWCKADTYLCAKGSYNYMKEDSIFPTPDITICFQDYHTNPYPQIGIKDDFIPYLSVLDSLMNIGQDLTRQLIINSNQNWLSWSELESEL